ncbi:hypothetical protein NMY22_g11452 [Coprinellus aureogranulatus]|nr:hypothetical protein NMY22_g11452 [Coprinellus aureogranulatus]
MAIFFCLRPYFDLSAQGTGRRHHLFGDSIGRNGLRQAPNAAINGVLAVPMPDRRWRHGRSPGSNHNHDLLRNLSWLLP